MNLTYLCRTAKYLIKMANLLKWPRIWFGIFLKPEETAVTLKKEKPNLIDGIVSFGFCSFLIGFIVFLISAIFGILLGSALGGPIASKAAGIGVGLLISFAILIIGFPLLMIIILLILTIFLKIASLLLKGKGSFGEECGILGVVGSSYLILMVLMYVVMFIPPMGGFMDAFARGSAGFGSMALMYLMMGVAYLIFIPLIYIVMAFTFDLLADIEQVSIYRSGAIMGLMFGIIFFIMMVVIAALMFIFAGVMYGLR